jgi:hypothetical protein
MKSDFLKDFKSAFSWQRDVKNDNVGILFSDQFQKAITTFRFSDHVHIWLLGEDFLQSLAYKLVVVYYDDVRHLGTFVTR